MQSHGNNTRASANVGASAAASARANAIAHAAACAHVIAVARANASVFDMPDALIRTDGDRFTVKTQFALKELCKSVPGATWDKTRRLWLYKASPLTAKALARAFGTIDADYDDAFGR